MFLKKTPKAKGTYLAITESYYDKEKKATRQKTIMGLSGRFKEGLPGSHQPLREGCGRYEPGTRSQKELCGIC